MRPEVVLIIISAFFSILAGAAEAGFAVVFADVLTIYADPSTMWDKVWVYNGLFIMVGVIALVGWIIKSWFGAISNALMVRRIRFLYFKALMRQEMGFFDDPRYPSGVLASRLMTDCSQFNGLGATKFNQLSAAFGSLATAFVIGFIFSWQLTLLCIGWLPMMAFAGMYEMRRMTEEKIADKPKEDEEGEFIYKKNRTTVTAETCNNILTVASLSREKLIIEEFEKLSLEEYRKIRNDCWWRGLAHGWGQSMIFFAYASVFRLGLHLVQNGTLTFDDVFKTLLAVIFGGMAMGQALGLMPDAKRAMLGAKRVFWMFERESSCNYEKDDGAKLSLSEIKGKIEFKDVKFSYPSRPDAKVLKGISFEVNPGETVALVGQSGCGKSTLIQLLERFYDADEGSITIDGQEIKQINPRDLRAMIGFVQQEPVLLNSTITTNIRSGQGEKIGELTEENYHRHDKVILPNVVENSEKAAKQILSTKIEQAVPTDSIIEASKQANAHDFISQLQHQYDTNVGRGGGQISGGQKQRVAIARTLVRTPKILLLDEATSALDNESEEKVNQAIKEARVDRTCIFIAHRLSTVRSADRIVAIDNGIVVETGTHDELVSKKGYYYNLIKAQL